MILLIIAFPTITLASDDCLTRTEREKCKAAIDVLPKWEDRVGSLEGRVNECRQSKETCNKKVKALQLRIDELKDRPTSIDTLKWTLGGVTVGIGGGLFLASVLTE